MVDIVHSDSILSGIHRLDATTAVAVVTVDKKNCSVG